MHACVSGWSQVTLWYVNDALHHGDEHQGTSSQLGLVWAKMWYSCYPSTIGHTAWKIVYCHGKTTDCIYLQYNRLRLIIFLLSVTSPVLFLQRFKGYQLTPSFHAHDVTNPLWVLISCGHNSPPHSMLVTSLTLCESSYVVGTTHPLIPCPWRH